MSNSTHHEVVIIGGGTAGITVAARLTRGWFSRRDVVSAGKAVLIDVREIDEWNDGHLAAAAFLPLSQIERGVSAEQLAKIAPAGKIVYLHCAFGSRSVTAAKYLSKTGRDVRPLKQGYDDLLEAGFRQAAK